MDDGVEAFEIGGLNIAQVFHDFRNRDWLRSKRTGAVEVGIQTHDLVTRLQKHRDQNGPDIASVPGNQNSHFVSFPQIIDIDLLLSHSPDCRTSGTPPAKDIVVDADQSLSTRLRRVLRLYVPSRLSGQT